MGALIILHGLFLIHCNETNNPVADGDVKLQPQYCEILSADNSNHTYRVGGGPNFVPLPLSVNLTVTLSASGVKDPDTENLDSRMLVLDSTVVKVKSKTAGIRIVVPMPDNLYAANVVRPFREDVLTTTDPNAIRSQPDSLNRIALAETVILYYSSGKPFSLMDSDTKVIDSAVVVKNNVMAFFAWPVDSVTNCATVNTHEPLNDLLLVNNQPPKLAVMGLGALYGLDDGAVSSFKLPTYLLRPPCVRDTSTERGPNGVRLPRTATQTGCGPEIDIEEN